MQHNLFSNLIPVDIEEEMKNSYLDYAMSVIVSRALPDVRDGLKPVHRRILYAMYENGYHFNKPYRKSSRIVGEVMGKYHPHGDAAIYDALVRMAQNFSLRMPLIDGQGNFGSIDGDSPAAQRYTESRTSKISFHLLDNIEKDTVNFRSNYDGMEHEPEVLPAAFPNLLVNGSGGIAVGMATNMPPHNLGEVIDACCLCLENPDLPEIELLDIIKGPDFPTKGIILGVSGIKSAYLTGKGIITVRGRAHVEETKETNNRESIIITEIPYGVNKAKLVEKIADLVREKRIEGISDLRDESDRSGIRVVVELKKDAQEDIILNQLYSYTQLQTSFGINNIALDGKIPKLMTLKVIIIAFLNFREEVITRRSRFLLNQARKKAHILLGLRIALTNIDEVIKIIKQAKDSQEAKQNLMNQEWHINEIIDLVKLVDERTDGNNKINLTEEQTKAILEMRLQRLTALEKNKLEEDLIDLAKDITEYLSILNSREKLLTVLKNELLEIKNEFATPRLTEIQEAGIEHNIEDLIQKEDMVLTVTLGGYVKRVPLSTYRTQRRGGKGRIGIAVKEEDITKEILVAHTLSNVLFFSNLGQVYSIKLYKIPVANPQSKGRSIMNILPLDIEESITKVMIMPDESVDHVNLIFATKKGNVRRSSLADFTKINSQGKIAIKLEDNDKLIGVSVATSTNHVLLTTKYGQCIRFPIEKLRTCKSRSSDGVIGMRLKDKDEVISITILQGSQYTHEERDMYLDIPLEQRVKVAAGQFPIEGINSELDKTKISEMAEKEEFILSITSNGYGKCSSAYAYKATNRGGTGILNMQLSEKKGYIVNVDSVKQNDEIILITNTGKLIRCSLDKVRITSRVTQGVLIFKTNDDEVVTSVAIISNDDDEECAAILSDDKPALAVRDFDE